MNSRIMPHLASMLSSDTVLHSKRHWYEITRRIKGARHRLAVFLSVSDPYSYLLLQVLAEVQGRFALDIELKIVRDKQPEMFPEADKWQAHSINDARHLAQLYQLTFPRKETRGFSQGRINHYCNLLLNAAQGDNAIEVCLALFHQFWDPSHETDLQPVSGAAEQVLKANQKYLHSLGHYQSATLYYAGEWYWGLDRLLHLEQRLNELGLSRCAPTLKYNRQIMNQSQTRGQNTSCQHTSSSLVMYYSARSPYSYLGLERAVSLCQRYQCQLQVKPVLPMMMRGLPVPQSKKMYIFHDTKRQAKLYGIPYGKVADPLGKAVENCYALFEYASEQGKAIDYLLAFGRAVNSQGIFAHNAKGMRHIVEKAGLNWQQAEPLLANQGWRDWADNNLQALSAHGLWGVPCFEYEHLVTWGQDRLWLIEQHMAAEKA